MGWTYRDGAPAYTRAAKVKVRNRSGRATWSIRLCELAEKELVEEMVSYRKDVTGIDHTVFISPKGHTRHSPRLNLAIDPPDTVDPRSKTASIAIKDAAVVAGEDVPAALLDQVRRFIDLNRGALLDNWEYRIDTEQLRCRLRPINVAG